MKVQAQLTMTGTLNDVPEERVEDMKMTIANTILMALYGPFVALAYRSNDIITKDDLDSALSAVDLKFKNKMIYSVEEDAAEESKIITDLAINPS